MQAMKRILLKVLALCSVVRPTAAISDTQITLHDGSNPKPLRVAIIGAGAAGSSCAFFLDFLERTLQVEASRLTVFERDEYVGGRSRTVAIPETSHYAEIGASIFVQANRNLMHASKVFNLTLQDGHGEDSRVDRRLAIYNGEDFVFQQTGYAFGYWDVAQLLWRYKTSPIKLRRLTRSLLETFVTSYTNRVQSLGPFRTIEDWASSLGFTDLYQQNSHAYLRSQGVSDAFIDDLIAAGTTVNYAQTPRTMSALEGMVSVAAEGASSVVGGNYQIFDLFMQRSQADLMLYTSVHSMTKKDNGKSTQWELEYSQRQDPVERAVFDVVIMAAPLHQTDITFISTDAPHKALQTKYVSLHVTLVVTNTTAPQACFFNPAWPCSDRAPMTVLTTLAYFQQGKVHQQPRINSLNYLRSVGEGRWVVKLFSMQALSDADLAEAFGQNSVQWVNRKQWLSYPYTPPVTEFSPIMLDNRFYYANAFEPLISTMETETIAAWNIARLIMLDEHGMKVNKSWSEWDAENAL